MSIETHQNSNSQGHGDYERRDISAKGIFYFLAGLALTVILVHLFLRGMYEYLDRRVRAHQPPLNPLVSNAPVDTRKVSPKYPETAFPDPRLETDERTQLNGIRLAEEQKLNSYDWVDKEAGTVRIPIERAMDLLAQRGLPLRPASAGSQTSAVQDKTSPQAKKAKGTVQ